MTRIADALRRARAGSSVGSDGGDSRVEDTFQFFAPGQPAVVSPWDIAEESLATPANGQSPRPRDRVAVMSSAPDADEPIVDEYVGFPLGESADKLVISPAASVLVRAQYNKLAAALHQAQTERGVKVVMLVSAGAAEGKTLTAVNLALTLSEAYQRRVLIVDADLRKPAVHELLGVSNARGLSDLLDRERPLPIVGVSPRLSLLPAGDYQDDPIKVVTSDRLWSLVEESRSRFDWIVIDTPPLGLVPDARLLAPMTDGGLLVTEAGRTTCDEIQAVAETFEPTRLIGVVLNRVPEQIASSTHLSEYYAPPER
jgi:capsular exopolysaccharide synthesis family protein